MVLDQRTLAANNVKKRRRPARSCEQCRQRKVKCDLEEPCGPCIRARASLACSYSPDTVRDGSSSITVQVDRPDVGPLPSSEPEQRWSVTSHHEQIPISSRMAEPDIQPNRNTEGAGSSLHSHDMAPERGAPEGTRLRRPTQKRTLSNLPAEAGLRRDTGTSELYITPLSPRLRVAPEKSRLLSSMHWSHTTDEFRVIGQLGYKESGTSANYPDTSLRPLMNDCRNMRDEIRARQTVTLCEPVPHLVSTFPERTLCDNLVDAYLRTFEVMYRILHVPTFRREYEQFWEKQYTSALHPALRIKLALIFAIGTTFHPERAKHESLYRLARVWIHAAQWWLTGPSEKSVTNLDGVQVACLLVLARQTTAIGTGSWLFADIALRVAMSAGLHRDPDHFPVISRFQAQMRRRLWYTALELTLQATFRSSIGIHLSTEQYDTLPPLNINDQDLDPESKIVHEGLPDAELSDCSIQRLLVKSLPLRLRTIAILSNHDQEQAYGTAIELVNEFKAVCREVNTVIAAASQRQFDSTIHPSKFHSQFLDIYLRQYILHLHRPFLIQARNNPRFYYSRKICLEAAMVIASYGYNLNLPLEPLDDLSHLCVAVRSWSNGPFSLDVSTMLGLELISQIEEEGTEAGTSLDPADIMAKSNRAPIFQALSHIQEQLFQIIALGSPSLKRYAWLSAILDEVRAMESRENVSQAILKSIKGSTTRLRPILEATIARSSTKQTVDDLTRSSVIPGDVPVDYGIGDLMDPDMNGGFADLFQFADTMTHDGMMNW